MNKYRLLLYFLLVFYCLPIYSKTLPNSLESMIGQMIMLGFHGTKVRDPKFAKIKAYIISGKVGGIIFYERNIVNKDKVALFIENIRKLPTIYPLLIAIDQEGGNVSRLKPSRGFNTFPSAKFVANNLSRRNAYKTYHKMATDIKGLGFNVNFAPVVDLNTNPESPAIGIKGRSYSANPLTVSKYAKQFIQTHSDVGLISTLKHFPGHGSANADSHFGFTDITKTWNKDEYLPYRKLINTGMINLIMSAHLYNANIDKKHPASLSKKHLFILRQTFGYKGVIITDDLQMFAITKSYNLEETVIHAINAGNDILLFANYFTLDTDLANKIIKIVINAIHTGEIKRKQITDSYERILLLKKHLI